MPIPISPSRAARRSSGVSRTVLVLVATGIGGLLLLIAAERLERPSLIGPGLLLFAIGTVAAGVQAVTARYVLERNSVAPRHHTFHGAAAVLIGISLVVLGTSIGVTGAAFMMGAQRALYDFAIARPGVALLPLGVSVGAGGASRVAGARQWRGSLWRVLANLPERIGGAMLMVLGAALAGLGGFELIAPEAFDDIVARLAAGMGLEY
jgi:hypothetical protein